MIRNLRIRKASELAEAGRVDEALDIVHEFLASKMPDGRGDAVELLSRFAERDARTRLNYGTALAFGDGCGRDFAKACEHLEVAARTGDRRIVGLANCTLGRIKSGREPGSEAFLDPAAAFAHYEAAAGLGNATGAFHAACMTENGNGTQADDRRAAELYRLGVELGSTDCMHNLGNMLLVGLAPGRPSDGLMLHRRAAENGDIASKVLLGSYVRFVSPDGTVDEDGLRAYAKTIRELAATVEHERFVPTSLDRPDAVWKALVNEFGLGHDPAQEITARFYGYERWHEVRNAVETMPASEPDERCDGETVSRRGDVQAKVLVAALGLPLPIAAAAIGLLRPTASSGRPSLRGMDKVLGGGSTLLDTLAAIVEDVADEERLDRAGDLNADDLRFVDDDISEERRLIWHGIVEEHGWDLHQLPADDYYDSEFAGIPWGFAFCGDGRRFDVHFAATVASARKVFKPEKHLVEAVEGAAVAAVVFFERPIVRACLGDEALLLGGALYMDGTWSNFCLDDEGLEGAISQRETFRKKPTLRFERRHVLPVALVHAAQMAHADPDADLDGIAAMEVGGGWKAIYVEE